MDHHNSINLIKTIQLKIDKIEEAKASMVANNNHKTNTANNPTPNNHTARNSKEASGHSNPNNKVTVNSSNNKTTDPPKTAMVKPTKMQINIAKEDEMILETEDDR